MNIENLREGQEFPSYRHLCEAIGRKPTGGLAKQTTLQDLARFAEFTVSGRKYTITRLLDIPMIKPPKKTSVWLALTVRNLLACLAEHAPEIDNEVESVFLERWQLYMFLGLCNDEYFFNRSKLRALESPSEIAKYFYEQADEKMKDVLNSVLTHLSKGYGLHISKSSFSFEDDLTEERLIASEIEEVQIKDLLDKTAFELGCESYNKALYSYKKKEFIDKSSKKLKEELGVTKLRYGVKFMFTNVISYRLLKANSQVDRLAFTETNKKMVGFLEKKVVSFCEELFFPVIDFKEGATLSKEEVLEHYSNQFRELLEESIKIQSEG